MTAPKPHIAHSLLSRAHPPETADQLFTERIKQKPLYLRPTSPSPSDNRERRRHYHLSKKKHFLQHQKPKPLSAREKRATGVQRLPREECKYAIFENLHALWAGYMQEILDLKDNASPYITPVGHGSKLSSADFHGAEVEIVRSRCAGRVGVRGIVVRDTKFTFVIVTRKDEVKTIPKEQTIFRFTVPLPQALEGDGEKMAIEGEGEAEKEQKKVFVFELHGSQFLNRPVDRASKKFKWRNIEYL